MSSTRLDSKDIERLKTGCTSSEPNTPRLFNVPDITRHVFDNYNAHVQQFIRFLQTRLSCKLIYSGPNDIREHILDRTKYACHVKYSNTQKILRNVFPVMVGSDLDFAIRHDGIRSFELLKPNNQPRPFDTLDLGRGFFIINGYLKHLPYLYTNDPTNTHLIQKRLIRLYTYDAHDRGKELTYYMANVKERQRGDIVVVHNDGSESTGDLNSFFEFCPHPVQQQVYMTRLYQRDDFDIDHLGNKIVITPGHLFVKLFVKYLYGPMRQFEQEPKGKSSEKAWKAVKSKVNLVVNSIESGNLLHVLSRKTLYFKENQSAGKMTSVKDDSYREIGADGQVFAEKTQGCYREVNSQTYPLNPYFLQMIVRQTSQKVKHNRIPAFHSSHVGFFCLMGNYETKNVGRTTMLTRDTQISTCYDLDPVFNDARNDAFWKVLNLQIDKRPVARFFVVVNEACIPVTQTCFQHVDLLQLKLLFRYVECWKDSSNFIRIRYKMGIIFKKLTRDVYVSPIDEMFWAEKLLNETDKLALVDRLGYDYLTGYMTDLNPFFKHNSFPKNIYAMTAMKSGVFAVGDTCALYFLDTISAFIPQLTPQHVPVLEPVQDGISPHFTIYAVKARVAYMSFMGCTQEDCIVRHKPVKAFDCCRYYTVSCRMKAKGPCVFYPVTGEGESEGIGSLVHRGEGDLSVEPISQYLLVKQKSNQEVFLHFIKTPYRVSNYEFREDVLIVSLEHYNESTTGDKLCSLHGQKGVVRVMDKVPLLDETVYPDLIVGPYCVNRMTMGQFIEGIVRGGGKDALMVRNSDGQLLKGVIAFYAYVYYIVISFFPEERLYAPQNSQESKLLCQALKGRSRNGGMKIGNMENLNGFFGNGASETGNEKNFEHGDARPLDLKTNPTIVAPKSIQLVQEDAKFFNTNLEIEYEPSVVKVLQEWIEFFQGGNWNFN